MRMCIIRGCGQALPAVKSRRKLHWTDEIWTWEEYEYPRPGLQYESWLCDDHYAPVSEAAVKRHIDRLFTGETNAQK